MVHCSGWIAGGLCIIRFGGGLETHQCGSGVKPILDNNIWSIDGVAQGDVDTEDIFATVQIRGFHVRMCVRNGGGGAIQYEPWFMCMYYFSYYKLHT